MVNFVVQQANLTQDTTHKACKIQKTPIYTALILSFKIRKYFESLRPVNHVWLTGSLSYSASDDEGETGAPGLEDSLPVLVSGTKRI